jgi:hypothetical protein
VSGFLVAVGDFFTEVVALTKLFSHDFHDIFGMTIILRENQSLRDVGSSGEYVGKQPVPKGLNHQSDLVFSNNASIQFVSLVLKGIVKLLPTHLPGQPIPTVNVVSSFYLAATLRNLRLDL